MVKIERTKIPPASLSEQKQKPNGSYKEPDVINQLFADFHEKCYICEQGELQSIEVEHLLPHHNGKDLERKFDWNNLFLSCSHCNSVKNRQEYERNIIDCCVVDPERMIHQKLTMNLLYKELDKYQSRKTEKTFRALRGMLNRTYKFSGFTRTYVRDNLDRYPELAPYVEL